MIHFKQAEIAYSFDLNPGDIVDLTIENPKFFFAFVKDLGTEEPDDFTLSEEGKDVDYSKTSLLIRDLFDLDPNSKRVLGAIYKKIDKSSLSPDRQKKFDEINAKIADLLTDISLDFEGTVSFNDFLSLPQLLGLIDFKFDYDDSTFLKSFLSYLKAWREAMDLKLVFVLNLFSLLSLEEIGTLSTELSYLGLALINISNFSSIPANEKVKKVIIDRDLCEIYLVCYAYFAWKTACSGGNPHCSLTII
jgi:CRISPR type II-A-associated protein Csn2